MHSAQPTYEPAERENQRSKLLQLLRAYAPDLAPIGEVVEVAGLQYGARVLELRRQGHRILNKPGEGFRLVTNPPTEPQPQPKREPEASEEPKSEPESDSLFGDMTPEPRYPD